MKTNYHSFSSFLSSFLWALPFLCYGALFLAGYPQPHGDDAFFIGAPIHFARTGQMINPWIAAWNPQAANRFFFQMPFYSQALGYYLKFFGVSAFSLLLFQFMSHTAVLFFIAQRLQKLSAPPFLLLLLSGSYLPMAFLYSGLRGDSLGIALLCAGLSFLADFMTRGHKTAAFLSGFFLTCTFFTWPTILFYSGGLIFWILLTQPSFPGIHFTKGAFAAFLSGVLFSILLFLFAIHFQSAAFWQDFSWHGSFRRPKLRNFPAVLALAFSRSLVMRAELASAVLLFFFILSASFLQNLKKRERWLCFLSAGSLGFGVLCYALTAGPLLVFTAQVYGFLCFFYLKEKFPVFFKITFAWVLGFSLLLTVSHFIFRDVFFRPKIEVSENPAIRAEIRQRILENKGISADSFSMRFFFDYKLPEKNILGWEYSLPAGFADSELSKKPAEDAWLLSSPNACNAGEKSACSSPRKGILDFLKRPKRKIYWFAPGSGPAREV